MNINIIIRIIKQHDFLTTLFENKKRRSKLILTSAIIWLRMFLSHFADFVEARFSDIPAKDADQNSSQNIGRIVNIKIHP